MSTSDSNGKQQQIKTLFNLLADLKTSVDKINDSIVVLTVEMAKIKAERAAERKTVAAVAALISFAVTTVVGVLMLVINSP